MAMTTRTPTTTRTSTATMTTRRTPTTTPTTPTTPTRMPMVTTTAMTPRRPRLRKPPRPPRLRKPPRPPRLRKPPRPPRLRKPPTATRTTRTTTRALPTIRSTDPPTTHHHVEPGSIRTRARLVPGRPHQNERTRTLQGPGSPDSSTVLSRDQIVRRHRRRAPSCLPATSGRRQRRTLTISSRDRAHPIHRRS